MSMPTQPPNPQFVQGSLDAPLGPDGQPQNAVVYNPPAQQPVYGQATTAAPQQVPHGYFTAEDLERVRREEKDKLYGRIEAAETRSKTIEEQLAAFAAEREQAAAAIRAQQETEAEAQRRKAEEEMSIRDLIAKREADWDAQMRQIQAEREQERVLFAKEQQFNQLQQYISRRAQEEERAESIAPELLDFIDGNTPEEVEAKIVVLRQKSEAIVQNMSQAQINARAQQRGVSTAGYASGGPMEDQMQQKTLTQEELDKMPMSEWAKIRGSVLGGAANAPRGMFG